MANKVIHIKNIANELYYSTNESSDHVEHLANASYHSILRQNLENMLIDCSKNGMSQSEIKRAMSTVFKSKTKKAA